MLAERIAKRIVKALRRRAMRFANERGITYEDCTASVTMLLACPKKEILARKHPRMAEALRGEAGIDIVKGFEWEMLVKGAIAETKMAEEVKFEPTDFVEVRLNGKPHRLVSHPDVVIESENEHIILELKAPAFVVLSDELAQKVGEGCELVCSEAPGGVLLRKRYIRQVALQRAIHEACTGVPTEGYIFGYSLTKCHGRYRRFYFLQKICYKATKEDLEALLDAFVNHPVPREPWECRFCPWWMWGFCQGTNEVHHVALSFEEPSEEQKTERAEEVYLLMAEYFRLKSRQEEIYQRLQSMIPEGEQFTSGNRVAGWTDRSYNMWNYAAIAEKLREMGCLERLNDMVRMTEEGLKIVNELFTEEDIKSLREVKTYRKFEIGYQRR